MQSHRCFTPSLEPLCARPWPPRGTASETVPLATSRLIAGTKRSAASFWWAADMRLWRIISTACALLPPLAPAPAYSQSIRGELGAQSRASIHISVTVMPRFQVPASPREPSLSSNAPALRYSLVRLPLDGSSASRAQAGSAGKGGGLNVSPGQGSLVLVVPD
jgi:hypothetical protein